MKTTLSVLIAALFLLTIPLSATAHDSDKHKQSSQRYSKSWDHDRHEARHDFRDHRRPYRSDHRAEKQHRKSARHHYAHSQREQRHYRPVYASAPAVIFGVPRIVFRIDW